MQDQLLGTTLPVLSISLEPGESVVAEAGEFSWMTDSIQMTTDGGNLAADSASGSLLSTYTAQGGTGTVAFAPQLPGSVLPVDVAPGREYLVHRHGFLAGTTGIELAADFLRPFAAGVFAAEGFALRRISGGGRAWVQLAGEAVRFELAPSRSLRVHPAHVGMFESSVAFQMVRVEGIANRYFDGAAHHFAVLSGPGNVWLQSTPLPVLAISLTPYLRHALTHSCQGGSPAEAMSSAARPGEPRPR